jgi:hypothetical protein
MANTATIAGMSTHPAIESQLYTSLVHPGNRTSRSFWRYMTANVNALQTTDHAIKLPMTHPMPATMRRALPGITHKSSMAGPAPPML